MTGQRLLRCVLVLALAGGVLAVGPAATGAGAAPARSASDPDGLDAGGAVPDDPREVPPDLADRTDTDGDGLRDTEETSGARNPWPSGLVGMAAPGDPTDPADPDSDDDGLSDGLEVGTTAGNRAGTATDPNAADTDADGVTDGSEVAHGTDPRNGDTDADGVDDGAEQAANPLAPDTDFDGRTDGAEVAAGSDPTVSDVTGAESATPIHFADVAPDAYYYDPAYWAVGSDVALVKPAANFGPTVPVTRWQLAVYLRRYAKYLGRDVSPTHHPFTDLTGLSRQARNSIAWASSIGVLPGTSATRFKPTRNLRRSEIALALFLFADWSGHDATASPADNPYTDTAALSEAIRGAIGWLHAEGVIQATGFITSPTSFAPRRGMNRGETISFLYRLDEVIGTAEPTGDTDGDGVSNLDEIQGSANAYPVPVDNGDPNPLDPDGQCIAPAAPGPLPPTGAVGAPTDPNDPDTDDDGISDGFEIRGQRIDHDAADGTVVAGPRTDPNDADTDNDCLTDGHEDTGWHIVLDEDGNGCDGGSGGGCPDLTRYDGYSDPLDVDTDDDGLPDHEENLLRTDAELEDTDSDGLTDFDEWNQWYTAPTSVDSDQDARGGDRTLPPTESLFDGIELRDIGTSPTLADTDGDGATDGDELDSPVRNPLLAELPGFDMELSGGTSIRLRKERSQEEGGALTVGLTNSTESSSSSTNTSSTTQRETHSFGVSVGLAWSKSFVPDVSLEFRTDHEYGTDTTREFSSEESQTIAQERSKTEETSWTSVESAASGEISQGMVFRNTGTFTYELSSVGYSLLLLNPDTLAFDVVGTMTVPLDGITLAPGASTQPIQVVADDVNVDLIEEFLKSPSSLHFSTSNIEFLDDSGRNLEFVQEQTYAQTAQLMIDFGEVGAEGYRTEEYNLATNVNRAAPGEPANGLRSFPGIRVGAGADGDPAYLQGVMDQIGYTRCADDTPADGCYTTDDEGDLASIDNVANRDVDEVGCPSHWRIITETPAQAATANFDDIVVHARDNLRFVLQTDCDRDGLTDNVESTVGACIHDDDCDDDHLNDLQEVQGWIVGYPALAGGAPCEAREDDPTPWRGDTAACPWVHSSPALADSDGDGVTDLEERDGAGRAFEGTPLDVRTDPRDLDTDGDGYSDCLTSGSSGLCAGAEPDPAPLHTSVRLVDSTPCGVAAGCWANPSTNLRASLALGGVNFDTDPRNDVRSIWVAGGTYPSPPGGFRLPGDVAIYGGFAGDETRQYDRNPDPTAAEGTRLLDAGGADAEAVVVVGSDGTTFDGFRVQGGETGGISGWSDDVHLANLRVTGNFFPSAQGGQSVGAGGITWIAAPAAPARNLRLDNVTVASNAGPVGGLHLENVDDAVITDSVIRNNRSDETFRPGNCDTEPAPRCSGGGGVSLIDGSATFDRSTITDNSALVGGGVDVSGADSVLRVISSEVTQNEARGDALVVGRGGGIHAREADVLLSNCLVGDNRAVVGPRWGENPDEDGFGGGVFAHDNADVRIINCTVAGNQGGGALIAGDEHGFTTPSAVNNQCGGTHTSLPYNCELIEGAEATVRNSVFYGNDMFWQPTYVGSVDGQNVCGGNCDLDVIKPVARGLLGLSEETSQPGLLKPCLGQPGPGSQGPCSAVWFTGLSASSSTELRSGHGPETTVRVSTFNTMVGAGSRHGEFGTYCVGLQYYGRTENPTYESNRGPILCGEGDDRTLEVNRYVGLRGRGFVGVARFSVAPPALDSPLGDFFQLPGYQLRAGAAGVDRGDQDIDWDPFTLDVIDDPPEFDLDGNPRIVGDRIDLGAYERQPQ